MNNSPFRKLPPELRIYVYELVLCQDKTIDILARSPQRKVSNFSTRKSATTS